MMTAMSGYVMYQKFVTGSRKGFTYLSDGSQGGLERDELLNGTWGLGKPQSQYTSRKVTLKGKVANAEAARILLKWCPVLPKSVELKIESAVGSGVFYRCLDAGDGTFIYDAEDGSCQIIEGGFDGRGWPTKEIEIIEGGASRHMDKSELWINYGSTRDDNFNPLNAAPNTAPRMAADISGSFIVPDAAFELAYEYENDYRN